MTARVSPPRIGRAYSVHTFTGTLGWAAAPVTMVVLAESFGWRTALVQVGLAGLLLAAFVALRTDDIHVAPSHKHGQAKGASLAVLTSAPVLACLLYFTLLSMAQVGMQNFMPSLLPSVQGVTYAWATVATTVYLVGSALGSLAGGWLADRTTHHERIVGMGLAAAGCFAVLFGFVTMASAVLLALVAVSGFLTGITLPSRDMLVRSATPPGSTGKVFGFRPNSGSHRLDRGPARHWRTDRPWPPGGRVRLHRRGAACHRRECASREGAGQQGSCEPLDPSQGLVTPRTCPSEASVVAGGHDPSFLSWLPLPGRCHPARRLDVPPLHPQLSRRRGSPGRARHSGLL